MGEQEVRQKLEEAQAALKLQDEFLKKITEGASPTADVVEVQGDKTIIAADGRIMSVNTPSKINVQAGDQVLLVPQTMQIISKLSKPVRSGEVTTVSAVHGAKCEVRFAGQSRLVVGVPGLEVGDRVVVDKGGNVVTEKLPSAEKPPPETGVSWDDIGGQDDAKRELREAIEAPHQHAELFKRYGHHASRGVLLYGSPGNGKTMLGKACATAIARISGARDGGFIYVKGPEVLSMWVGESESNVRQMFERARAYRTKAGHPAVIFVDEAESVLGHRDQGSFMGRTVVPAFLAEMDGVDSAGAFVLLATNRPDGLDPAAVRDGRIDRRVLVPRPKRKAAQDIFAIHLKGKPLHDTSTDELAEVGSLRLFDPTLVLFDVPLESGRSASFTFADAASGAMIAGLVQRATQSAIRREIAGPCKPGITLDDVRGAVTQAFEEQRHVDHRLAVEEFLERIGEKAAPPPKSAPKSNAAFN